MLTTRGELVLKTFGILIGLAIALLTSTALGPVSAIAQGTHENKHGVGVRQFDAFHDVLHPLQHEALPNKDFQRIRNESASLHKRGRAIVLMGVPRNLTEENKKAYRLELQKFGSALTRFRNEALRGSDAQLEKTFTAVHDSFEMLASMLPRG